MGIAISAVADTIYVDTVGRKKERIAKYIWEQLQSDVMADQ